MYSTGYEPNACLYTMSAHPIKTKTLKEWRKQLETVRDIQRLEKELSALEKEARRRDRKEKRDKEREEREVEETKRLTAENGELRREIALLDPEHPDAAPRASHKVRRSRRPKCFCCGVKGHLQKDCWFVPQ